jgi:fatty-acyl-CoA synthase
VQLPLTPTDFLVRARRLFPDREGVIQHEDGQRAHVFTYAQHAERAARLAQMLRDDFGVRRGDRVAWLCGNRHELLEAYFGVLLAGGVLLPLNIRLSAPELEWILDDSRASVLIRDPALTTLDHPVREVLIDDTYEERLAAQPLWWVDPPEVDENDVAELFYTSGSTGRPKGAMLTHRNLYLHAIHSALNMSISGHDVIIHTIPLFHVNGWGTPHYMTALGGVQVMLPRFDSTEVLRLVEAERVTRLYLVPAMMTVLLNDPTFDTRDLSSLKQLSVGGAPTPPALLVEAERRFGCECICGYGMTETAPQLTKAIDKPGEPRSARRRSTTGMPILGVDLRIFDEENNELPWDGATPGEIRVRSNHVMAGYWEKPDDTDAALSGGWMHTGDVGTMSPDGFLTIVDRKKDIIISGGENISSIEVEDALYKHSAVAAAAVVAKADDKWGETPCAFIELKPGMQVTADELMQWCRKHLAGYKCPRHVVFAEIPKTSTGKIQKFKLREMAKGV